MSAPYISQSGMGDDTDNLACEFSPASDMVLRLHASLQPLHARDGGRMRTFKLTFIEYNSILPLLIKTGE